MPFPTTPQINPMLLAALMQGGQGGGMGGMAPQMPNTQGGSAGAAPQFPGVQQRPQQGGMGMPPIMTAPQMPQGPLAAGGGASQNPQQIMQLLQQLKGQQQSGAPTIPSGANTSGLFGSPITMPSQISPSVPPVGGMGEYSNPIGPMQPNQGIMGWLQGLFGGGQP